MPNNGEDESATFKSFEVRADVLGRLYMDLFSVTPVLSSNNHPHFSRCLAYQIL